MASEQTIKLPPMPDAAEALLTRLLAARRASVRLRADREQWIGGPCAQILIAARRDWPSADGDLRLTAPSPALIDGLARLGKAPAQMGAEVTR